MILAFDTSGPIGSVAVAHEGDVLARGLLRVQTGHASGLVPMIDQVLQEAGVDRGELTGLVVGEGPGSFTGVRVAAATAKGLSRALTLPVWPVSSLAAAALAVDEGAVRYALFDARAERVYGACYGVGGARIQTLVPPHAGELREVLDGDVPPGVVFVGDASERHRAVIEGAGFPVVDSGSDVSLADGLIRFWAAHPDGFGPVDDPGAWEPEYVRASSAERLWR
ncbi:MAG: tRNA (adenosine(37)-N6)-threonylcarbamoyltransferase complex dimerization subunit type 1 TsaB [Longimicrobiales bacterium]